MKITYYHLDLDTTVTKEAYVLSEFIKGGTTQYICRELNKSKDFKTFVVSAIDVKCFDPIYSEFSACDFNIESVDEIDDVVPIKAAKDELLIFDYQKKQYLNTSNNNIIWVDDKDDASRFNEDTAKLNVFVLESTIGKSFIKIVNYDETK